MLPNDAGFPSVNDIEKALKLARRCDPVLAEMMKATQTEQLRRLDNLIDVDRASGYEYRFSK